MSIVDTPTTTTVVPPTMNSNASHPAADLKRKRSPSHEEAMHPASAPLPKQAKTHNHLQINYLARQCENDLPLITNDDTLPNILTLLGDYQGVLDRHESMACNLGARPLGPILIKRFERLFDGPPRVLKTHGKDGTTVTWLDVVEFARNKPEQFQLGQMSEGVRVCQFYTKQCRVQISEEDFVLISSGIPQKMIPPQPIIEDEEKELGTLDILEKNLGQICQLADQVAARTRQLNHRLKGRKQAILDRRANASPAPPKRPSSPSNVALMNGTAAQSASSNLTNMMQTSQSAGGFVAVNARPPSDQNGSGASTTTRHDLMSKFHTLSDRRTTSAPANGASDTRRLSMGPHSNTSSHPPTPVVGPMKATTKPAEANNVPMVSRMSHSSHYSDAEIQHMISSPVPIPNTPSSLLPAANQRSSQPAEKDDGGPFKTEMVHRMESLAKGERILPPCDRCRRLHMDCLKNLTACMGCTKKHAKCSWKEVREPELRGVVSYHVGPNSGMGSESEDVEGGRERASTGSPGVSLMSPPRQGIAPAANSNGAGGAGGSSNLSPEARMIPNRTSPPDIDRDRDRDVAAQLQEAAKSGLRLGGSGNKGAEYQTLVA